MMTLAESVGEVLKRKNKKLVTAESCTGGWISQEVTSIPGSSSWFECGFVTYSNRSKQQLLGVSLDSLQEFGAVSAQVVEEMAVGAIANGSADFSVATSGIAGPGGASDKKPVGTVYFAWADAEGRVETEKYIFPGDRESVRKQAVEKAFQGILKFIVV